MDNPIDFYSSRVPKKQRKRTILEEIMSDPDFLALVSDSQPLCNFAPHVQWFKEFQRIHLLLNALQVPQEKDGRHREDDVEENRREESAAYKEVEDEGPSF